MRILVLMFTLFRFPRLASIILHSAKQTTESRAWEMCKETIYKIVVKLKMKSQLASSEYVVPYVQLAPILVYCTCHGNWQLCD